LGGCARYRKRRGPKKAPCSREGGSPSSAGSMLRQSEMGQYRVDHAPHGVGSSGGRSDPMLLRGDTRDKLALWLYSPSAAAIWSQRTSLKFCASAPLSPSCARKRPSGKAGPKLPATASIPSVSLVAPNAPAATAKRPT